MLAALLRHRVRTAIGLVILVAAAAAGVALASRSSADVTVYNGRSQYGAEQAFTAWEDETGKSIELRGGTAPELFERLRSEGDSTPADLLVTTDLANLWRAKEAGLLAPVRTGALAAHVPEELRDPDGAWWAMSVRIRTPMRNASVPEDAVTSYEDLGDPRWSGRLCLRTSNNEYNQSLVADMLAKRGREQTRALLESWMANKPRILGSDVDVLDAIAAGRCDVGLTNDYYLARKLADDPDFPVAPAWPDQEGAGAHANLSGVGLVAGSEHRQDAIALMEHLTDRPAQAEITKNGEMAANPDVPAPMPDWEDVEIDPIDVSRAGALLPDAIALMQQVGWT